MLDGASTLAKPPGRWTDVSLANALTEVTGRKHPFPESSIRNWRTAKVLPDSIAPLLAVFFDDSDALAAERQNFVEAFRDAQVEKWGAVKKKATDRAAPQFVAQGKTHVIDRTPRETDARAARNEKQQALQAAVRGSAERFSATVASRGDRYSNTPIWRELAVHARRLADIAALDAKTLVAKLPDAYDVSLYLGGRLELDDRINAGKSEEPALDLDVRGDLVHLVRLAAPWLRGFPSVRKLDDAAARGLNDFADFGPARDLIEAAAKAAAIAPEDAQEMRTLAEAAESPEFLGRKAKRRLVGGAGNLALSLGETEAERQADALDLSDDDVRARAEATRTTLIKAGADIDRLPLPEDVRAAFRSLVAEAICRPATEFSAPAAPPEDVEARARELVLKGIAPPKAWWPWIKKLDFREKNLTDATPLSGLTSLTSLDLSYMLIADATPLSGLRALTSLNLSRTLIADATPISGLRSLTSLDISRTLIADVTPLSGLTSLTTLDLCFTRIADATPLSGLTSLTTLNLWGTPITDATPLSGLTSLTHLYLGGTKVNDLAPLAGLIARGLYIFCGSLRSQYDALKGRSWPD